MRQRNEQMHHPIHDLHVIRARALDQLIQPRPMFFKASELLDGRWPSRLNMESPLSGPLQIRKYAKVRTGALDLRAWWRGSIHFVLILNLSWCLQCFVVVC